MIFKTKTTVEITLNENEAKSLRNLLETFGYTHSLNDYGLKELFNFLNNKFPVDNKPF